MKRQPVYYVATLARYILVEASNADEATTFAPALLAAVDPRPCGPIRTVRLATKEELELQEWHNENLLAWS